MPARAAATARLNAIRVSVLRTRRVIRRFLRNVDVMRMVLLHRRPAYLDEAGARPQLLHGLCPAVTHPGPQAADELVDELGQRALVWHAALDSFRHQLPGLRDLVALLVAVA